MKNSWKQKIDKDYIRDVIQKKIRIKDCYPGKETLWESFSHFEYENTKVVFLFSGAVPLVLNDKTTKELRDTLFKHEWDITIDVIFDYTLNTWRKQGVLILNDVFTISKIHNKSHIDLWTPFLQDIITKINEDLDNIVWVFFSNTHAHLITNPTHKKLLDLKHNNPFSWVNEMHDIKWLQN